MKNMFLGLKYALGCPCLHSVQINAFVQKSLTLILCFLIFAQSYTFSQGIVYPLTNEDVYHMVDRFEILYGNPSIFYSSQKTFTRGDITRYAQYLDTTANIQLSNFDKNDIQYIYDDNNDWLAQSETPTTLTGKKETTVGTLAYPQYRLNRKPFLKFFYKTPANFWEMNKENFSLRLNPILNFKISQGRDDEELIFMNQRGLELRGSIDKRVHFYTNILESQARFPDYATDWIIKHRAIPGVGRYKTYQSLIFNIKNGYDFINAQGLISFNATPHIGVQFGHGKNFIGDGMRSLFLSDFANNYFFLKLNTKIWKFQYQNIFAELANQNVTNGDELLPKKFIALHHLSYNVTPNLNFGIFESVIASRKQQFELQYLNPIIFYRSVEFALGSPDNVSVGANGKWNIGKKCQIYGQLMLDEFVFKELFVDNKGWWANKYGMQLGIKYPNALGIDHFDLQLEYNKVRPFTYSHYDSTNHYTHIGVPLAHPLGSNFKEVIFKARYQPLSKIVCEGRIMYAKQGESSLTKNWGETLTVPYTTRTDDYGYFTAEGVKAKILLMSFDASYQIYHNMFLDMHILARKKDSDDPTRNQRTLNFGGGFRMNIGNTRLLF
ncbi:MAG: hypothetical protein JNL70_23300 [Saprospiraceae bacterium]|nr:hypothetical protein [Saprospiraceae bacterium]